MGCLDLGFPSSGCAAGENQAVFCNWKSDFLGFYLSAEGWNDFCADHIREYRRCKTGGVGVDQEKQRLIR